MGPAAEDHQVLLGGALHSGHVRGLLDRRTGAVRILAQKGLPTQHRGPPDVHRASPRPRRRAAARRSAWPSRLRWGPPLTASAPGGTSRRTTVPPPVIAPSPMLTGATKVLLAPSPGASPTAVLVLVDPVVVGEDRAGTDVGARHRSTRRRRRTGAAPWRRAPMVAFLISTKRADLALRRRASCPDAGRRTGRRWHRVRRRRALPACAPPGRRRRPRSPSACVSGPTTASSVDGVAPMQLGAGQDGDVGREHDVGVDPGRGRVHHGDAVTSSTG